MTSTAAIDIELFGDLAAFYAVREHGFRAAIRDLLKFRLWVQKTLSESDTLILEGSVSVNRLAISGFKPTVLQVPRIKNAYVDRERVLRPFLEEVTLVPCAMPTRRARRVLVNPFARARSRMLSFSAVETTLQVAFEANSEVCLVDMDGKYEKFRSHVREYLFRPTLMDAAHALREADAYVGPDSFFMHLAYYLRVPFLAFFSPSNMYFAPPGLMEQGNYVFYRDARVASGLSSKLRKLLMPRFPA